MDTISQFKCPNCGAPLRFDAGEQKLVCDNCGGRFEADGTLPGSRPVDEVEQFNWGSYKEELSQETLEDMSVYNCVSCGAIIEADPTTAATKCPYCGNNVVLNDQISGGLRPNGIIPFRITPEQLPDAIQRFYGKKPLLPRGFFSANSLGKVQGIYVPFWLYDCQLEGRMNLTGTRVRSYIEGDYECTETSYYVLERDGGMRFVNMPVDGSVKMDDDLMDSIEPFDFSQIVDFNSSYLSGYLADRFDNDPDELLPRASRRLMNSATDIMLGTCAGYGDLRCTNNGLQIRDAKVRYVLLPVYLLNCEYGGKKYRYAVNGQTGKVVGELPVSKGKSFAWFAGVAAAVAVVAYGILSMLL